MDPAPWVALLSSALRETIIVALAIFNFIQWRQNNQLREGFMQTLVSLTKEGREMAVEGSKEMALAREIIAPLGDLTRTSVRVLEENTAVLKRIEDHVWRQGR